MGETSRPTDSATRGRPGVERATVAAAGSGRGPRRPDLAPDRPHARPAAAILDAFAVSPEAGLDDADVRARQAAFGRNALDLQPPKATATILLHQLQSSVVALLGA